MKSTCHIGQMTFAIALPGFNDLGRSVTPILVTPIFLLVNHFLYQSSMQKRGSTKTNLLLEFCAPLQDTIFLITQEQDDWVVALG